MVCAACAADVWDTTSDQVIEDAELEIVGGSSVAASTHVTRLRASHTPSVADRSQ